MPFTLLPTAYLGPVQHYYHLRHDQECRTELYEHFPKQTYRNRCEIYSPNGKLILTVPLIRRNQRQAVKDVRIAYETDWQTLHWRSLESCYRRSPFFEFYEDDLYPFFHDSKPEFLVDLNERLEDCMLGLLKLKPARSHTNSYEAHYEDATDLRSILSPKHPGPDTFHPLPYSQVFENRHGFIPNLSIVDLLFNHGPRATDYI